MKVSVKSKEKEVAMTAAQLEQMDQQEDDFEEEYMTEADKKLISLQETLREMYGDVAPTLSQLEAWKKRHENIYVSHVNNGSKEIYVWRVLRRYEYKQMKEGDIADPESFNEMIVEKCLLFPNYDFHFRQSSVAGTITTLGAQISYKSGFVGEQEALNLIFIS